MDSYAGPEISPFTRPLATTTGNVNTYKVPHLCLVTRIVLDLIDARAFPVPADRYFSPKAVWFAFRGKQGCALGSR